MKIAVRLDDITADMDWQRFLRFKELLEQHQLKPLIGVVPDNQDPNLKGKEEKDQDFWAYIRELQKEGWVVAMHGYRHIYTTQKKGLFPLNAFSEFAGVPYQEQLSMLKAGKKILSEHGIETDLFMAPAHTYDKNTLKALKETGFMKLTDGFGNRPYLRRGLVFYPISFKLSRTLKKRTGYSTLVVHTGTLSDADFERYRNYFKESGAEWISYREYLDAEPEQRGFLGECAEYLMAAAKAVAAKTMLIFHK